MPYRALILLALLTRAAHGQELSGTVRDAATGVALSGAVVTALSSDRQAVARSLTSRAGRFQLAREGATALRVQRIGYRPWEMPLERIASGPLTIELVPVGSLLDAVVVREHAVCPPRRDQREALALWTMAQDGLLALVVASSGESETGEITQILFDRRLESDGRGILSQRTRRVTTGNVVPIRAGRNAGEFARLGYVQRTAEGTTYYAPDPIVLLDSTFAATHCLSVRRDSRGHPDEVGVAFTPIAGRDTIPDIAGVLWLARAPLALRSLDFEYVGIDPVVRATRAGGRLDFETLANGVPIIRSWHVRSPRLLYLPAGTASRRGARVAGQLASVASLHENGAVIAAGTLSDGTSWSAPLATVSGRVVNAREGSPVPGARVVLDSTDHAGVTDPEGRFTFEGLLPGPYVIRVTDTVVVPRPGTVDTTSARPPADTLPVPPAALVVRTRTQHLDASAGDVRQVEVRLPWRDPLGACYGDAATARRGLLVVGTVVTPGRVPLAGAAVRLSWADTPASDSAGAGAATTVADAETDLAGRFVVCGVPAEVPVSTRVRGASGSIHEGTTMVPATVTDELGRPYRGTVRFVTLTVSPAKS